MDDPNIPNLLSIDYIGFKSHHDSDGIIKENTRKFILSSDNKYYVETSFLK
jgi:meiotically up-regulated gene 157 (Mug157) protein